jgi:hypothetical protein
MPKHTWRPQAAGWFQIKNGENGTFYTAYPICCDFTWAGLRTTGMATSIPLFAAGRYDAVVIG